MFKLYLNFFKYTNKYIKYNQIYNTQILFMIKKKKKSIYNNNYVYEYNYESKNIAKILKFS